MIRITTSSAPNGSKITVDGELMGEYVEAVANCCKQAMRHGKTVRVVLRDVPNIDERGRALLANLAAEGVHLNATGIYSAYVVAGICREVRRQLTLSGVGPAVVTTAMI